MAKEMAIVDPAVLKTIQLNKMTTRPAAQNIRTRVLQEKDSSIKNTLADEMLTPSDKLFFYNQALQSRGQYSEARTARQIEPSRKIVRTDDDYSIEDELLASVPISFREKAKLILKRLKHSDVLGFNEHTGRMLYKGSEVRGTNVVDIVHTLLRARKARADPVGWDLIKQAVQELNLPTELVGNPQVYQSSADISKGSKKGHKKNKYNTPLTPQNTDFDADGVVDDADDYWNKHRNPNKPKHTRFADEDDDDETDQEADQEFYDAQAPTRQVLNFDDSREAHRDTPERHAEGYNLSAANYPSPPPPSEEDWMETPIPPPASRRSETSGATPTSAMQKRRDRYLRDHPDPHQVVTWHTKDS